MVKYNNESPVMEIGSRVIGAYVEYVGRLFRVSRIVFVSPYFCRVNNDRAYGCELVKMLPTCSLSLPSLNWARISSAGGAGVQYRKQ